MSVVGFDIGNQTCHIAIARHGGVEMVSNEYSDRKTPSIVGFGAKQRTMGLSAKNQMIMNFKNTIWGFKILVGRKFSDPFVQEEIKQFPYEVVKLPNDGIGIKVHYGDEDVVLSPEQVTATLLTYLKKTAEKALGKPVADCVISVPSYFTDAQRRALLDTSTIAGLNCLRLMNDTTATALAYGIYKENLPAENEKPRNVVFVDMGHSCLQVVVCAFQKGKLKVLSKAFDPTLGGRNFDRRIVEHFAAEFKQRYRIDSLSKPRQRLRLTNECEKLKKNMSPIATSIPINIDCFSDDKDVIGHMKREEFNKLCDDLLERIKAPLQDALARSGLSLEAIDAVELVGGSCRVPAVKNRIMEVFKKELSTTLNFDESVARGCALQCAMLSPTFKVRDFSITDIQPYPIQLRWQAAMEGEEGEMVVFKEGDAIYHSKVLSFFRKEHFKLEACYANLRGMPYPNPLIGQFHIKNVSPTEEGEASKVKVKVRVNIHGVFFIKSATMVEHQKPEEAMETEPPPQPQAEGPTQEASQNGTSSQEQQSADTSQPATSTPDNGREATQQQSQETEPPTPQESADGPVGDQPSPEGQEGGTPDQQGEQAPPPEQNASSGGEGNSKESPKTEKKKDTGKQPETKKPKKPTVKYIDLPIEGNTPSLVKTILDLAREKEVNMDYQDQLEKEKIDAKNAVEEYVYNMRDKLEYSLREYISDDDRSKFLEQLSATEEWLYDEGEDQAKKVYVNRLKELQKPGDAVEQREREWIERPGAFNDLGASIIHFEKILELYAAGDELYNHLEEGEMQRVKNQVETKRTWLNSQMQACTTLLKHVDPPVKSVQIRAEKQNLETACNPTVTKPKPKVEPPKDDPPKDDQAKQGEASNMEVGDNQEGGNPEGKNQEGGGQEGGKEEVKMEEEPRQPTGADDMDVD